jgi:hypothetical protein
MKRMLWILLVPTLTLAQQPQSNPTSADFNGLRNKLAQSLRSHLSVMQTARSCLASVQDQTGFEGCFNQIPASMKQELQTTVFATQPTTYSPENQQRSLQTLDGWIQGSQAVIGCFQGAADMNQLRGCVGASSKTSANPSSGGTAPVPPPIGVDKTQLSEDW